MKLLFDQNLSDRLVEILADTFPESTHVRRMGLDRADDETVWQFAKAGPYVIVTKDPDFHERSIVFGHPPKVIWIRRGNCSTQQVKQILCSESSTIQSFNEDAALAVLMLY